MIGWITGVKLTPQEQFIIGVLSDGGGHATSKFIAGEVTQYKINAFKVCLTGLRKKLIPRGYNIVSERKQGSLPTYRLMRQISTEEFDAVPMYEDELREQVREQSRLDH